MKKIYIHNTMASFGKMLKNMLKPAWMVVVLVLFGTRIAYGQIAVEIHNPVNNSTTTQNNTFSYTVPAGINNNQHRMLMVMITSGERGITTITYRGIPLQLVVNDETTNRARTYIYRMLTPTAGIGDLVVNFDGGLTRGAVVGIMTLGNVNTANATPTSAATAGTTSTATISHSVISVGGQRVFNVVASLNNALLAAGAGQTELWKTSVGSEPVWGGASHITATGTSTTMTWARTTNNTNAWSISMVAVNPVCVLGTVSTTNPTCIGGNNGSITVSSPTGGSGSYQYQLNSGAWQSSNTFTGLAPGTYSVQIRDANNTTCTVNLGSYTLATSPVAFEAVTTGAAISGTVGTVSHTTGTNANRLMLVGVSTRQRTITVPAQGEETLNVTYGGDPLIYVGGQTSQDGKTYIFMMVDPPSGTADVSVTFTGGNLATTNAGIIGVTTYSNVNINNPIGSYFSNVGTSTAPSLTISSTATNQRILNVFASDVTGLTLTPNSGQTQRWFSNANQPTAGGYGLSGQASSTVSNYTLSASQRWSLSGVAINPMPVADLAITKTVDDTGPYAGHEITFTLTATNLGCDNAPNATVSDMLPTGFTYVSHSTANGTYNGGSGEWAIGTLNSGSTATLTINAVVNKTGVYTNTATISADVVDNSAGNNTASVSITLCQAGGTQPLFNN